MISESDDGSLAIRAVDGRLILAPVVTLGGETELQITVARSDVSARVQFHALEGIAPFATIAEFFEELALHWRGLPSEQTWRSVERRRSDVLFIRSGRALPSPGPNGAASWRVACTDRHHP